MLKITIMPPCDSSFLTSPVEFPCGRTALKEVSAVSTRSLMRRGNSLLPNTSPTSINTTTSPYSTPASTPGPFPATNDSVKNQSRKKLPWWVFRDAEVPTEEPATPFKRIVGGEVVTPGEIPWQVVYGSTSTWCMWGVVLIQEGDEQQLQLVHVFYPPFWLRSPW